MTALTSGANLRHTDKRLQQSGPAPPPRASPRAAAPGQSPPAPPPTPRRASSIFIDRGRGLGAPPLRTGAARLSLMYMDERAGKAVRLRPRPVPCVRRGGETTAGGGGRRVVPSGSAMRGAAATAVAVSCRVLLGRAWCSPWGGLRALLPGPAGVPCLGCWSCEPPHLVGCPQEPPPGEPRVREPRWRLLTGCPGNFSCGLCGVKLPA